MIKRFEQQKGNVLPVIIVIAVVAIIAGLGFVVWNNFFKSDTPSSNAPQTNQPSQSEEPKIVTVTLPNGKIATYPNTAGNENVTFSDAQNGDPQTIYVAISHKKLQSFLATIEKSVVDEVCGTDSNLKANKTNLIVGLLNTTDKTITSPQNANCVDLLAASENSDGESREAAEKLLNEVSADINAFLASVTIK